MHWSLIDILPSLYYLVHLPTIYSHKTVYYTHDFILQLHEARLSYMPFEFYIEFNKWIVRTYIPLALHRRKDTKLVSSVEITTSYNINSKVYYWLKTVCNAWPSRYLWELTVTGISDGLIWSCTGISKFCSIRPKFAIRW